MECYNFKQYNFNDGLLDVDATFIIHLEGTDRIENIKFQLERYKPSKIVYIVYNQGYKKCKKPNVTSPPTDLVATFLEIFKFSQKENMKRILILEDDYDFTTLKQEDLTNVNRFIKENKNYIYQLGTVPYISRPVDTTTSRVYLSTGAHACIYSNEFINDTLNHKGEILDWDWYINIYGTRYMYNKPLCYQTFPDTENSKNWGFGSSILRMIYKFLNMDKVAEPGYTIFYYFSILLPLFLAIILIYIFIKFFQK
jgi:hypothetical protein